MKSKFLIIALLLISCIISSCSSEDDDFNYQNDFEESQKIWLDFKESSNNSYKYVVSEGSGFTTYGWETTVTVSNGIIIKRDFKYTAGAEGFVPEDQLEWTENQNEINSPEHEHTSAFPALTLDTIYTKAKQEWLIKKENTDVFFESENDGMISTCGYVMNNCLDDCFVGVHIKNIKVL
ncbi:hypothetical protein [Maribacter cobaltidurans]|uniref:Uncharacterized protein n=1 Tax=Maribacter cobaltidurans TaxID=1178778 RepID=A0A223VBV4_9FLAO|nr:hypothetical protein [Maribacter cobaltidurans]ASV32690.1 hypothetical protein CJ263_12695 [Maribacter cobaltidurans]GGD73111.1 hypothetical protein GCM10011412_08460 [Maribacter cobaltidurans]